MVEHIRCLNTWLNDMLVLGKLDIHTYWVNSFGDESVVNSGLIISIFVYISLFVNRFFRNNKMKPNVWVLLIDVCKKFVRSNHHHRLFNPCHKYIANVSKL